MSLQSIQSVISSSGFLDAAFTVIVMLASVISLAMSNRRSSEARRISEDELEELSGHLREMIEHARRAGERLNVELEKHKLELRDLLTRQETPVKKETSSPDIAASEDRYTLSLEEFPNESWLLPRRQPTSSSIDVSESYAASLETEVAELSDRVQLSQRSKSADKLNRTPSLPNQRAASVPGRDAHYLDTVRKRLASTEASATSVNDLDRGLLSSRELETQNQIIKRLMAEGCSVAVIARKLDLPLEQVTILCQALGFPQAERPINLQSSRQRSSKLSESRRAEEDGDFIELQIASR